MRYYYLWERDPSLFVLLTGMSLLGLVVGFTIHEFSHAWVAQMEGDRTASRMGRLTLNPLKHIDPVGFALILIVGFGWAKPVQVDPRHLRRGRLGMAMVAFAGPLSNVALAVAVCLAFRLGLVPLGRSGGFSVEDATSLALFLIAIYNLLLAAFNLIPLPPLDGSKVVGGLLPEPMYRGWLEFERRAGSAALILIFGAMAIAWIADVNPLGEILWAATDFVFRLAAGDDAARFFL